MDATAEKSAGTDASGKERVDQDEGLGQAQDQTREVQSNLLPSGSSVNVVTRAASTGSPPADAIESYLIPSPTEANESDKLNLVLTMMTEMNERSKASERVTRSMGEQIESLKERMSQFEARTVASFPSDRVNRTVASDGSMPSATGLEIEEAATWSASENDSADQGEQLSAIAGTRPAITQAEIGTPYSGSIDAEEDKELTKHRSEVEFQEQKRKSKKKPPPKPTEQSSVITSNRFSILDRGNDDREDALSSNERPPSETSSVNDPESGSDQTPDEEDDSEDEPVIEEVSDDDDKKRSKAKSLKALFEKILKRVDIDAMIKLGLGDREHRRFFDRNVLTFVDRIKRGSDSRRSIESVSVKQERIINTVQDLCEEFSIENNKRRTTAAMHSKRIIQIKIALNLCALGRTTNYAATGSVNDSYKKTAKGLSTQKIDQIVSEVKKIEGDHLMTKRTALSKVACACMAIDDGGYFSRHCHNHLDALHCPLRAELMPEGKHSGPDFHEAIMTILRDIQIDNDNTQSMNRDPYLDMLRLVISKGTSQASDGFVDGKTTEFANAAHSGLVQGEAATVGAFLYRNRLNFFRAFGLLTNNQATALMSWAGSMSIASDGLLAVLKGAGQLKGLDKDRLLRLESEVHALKQGSALNAETVESTHLTQFETMIQFPFPIRYIMGFLQTSGPESNGSPGDIYGEKYQAITDLQQFKMDKGESPRVCMDRLSILEERILTHHGHHRANGQRFIDETKKSLPWRYQMMRSVVSNYAFYHQHQDKEKHIAAEFEKITGYVKEWRDLLSSVTADFVLPALSPERMKALEAELKNVKVKSIETRSSRKARTAAAARGTDGDGGDTSDENSDNSSSRKKTKKKKKAKAVAAAASGAEPKSNKFLRVVTPGKEGPGRLYLNPKWKSDWSKQLTNEAATKLSESDLKTIGGGTFQTYEQAKSKERRFRYVYDAVLLEKVLCGDISPILPNGVRVLVPQPQGIESRQWDHRYGRLKQTSTPSAHAAIDEDALAGKVYDRIVQYIEIRQGSQSGGQAASRDLPTSSTANPSAHHTAATSMRVLSEGLESSSRAGDRMCGYSTVYNVTEDGVVVEEEQEGVNEQQSDGPRSDI